jgi:outer membrane receptor protein involved in Fe transport
MQTTTHPPRWWAPFARFPAVGALVVAMAGAAWAQTTASVYGTITDTSGGVLPGVAVTATSTLTNATHTTRTDGMGAYTLPQLPIGSYSVRAELDGFTSVSREGIALSLNRNARVDFSLAVGKQTETVIVASDAPLVDGRSNEMGTVIDERRIQQLPLNGRNALALVSLVPGAQGLQAGNVQGFESNAVAFNGARPELSNYLLDGGDNTQTLRNYGNPDPNPDALEETRVISNNYSAEYGRSVGAIVNVVTKSGTNTLHGSAFEFFRNDALNGEDAFAGAKLKLDQHQFGATLGGPLTRDRTFFFLAYQGLRVKQETAPTSTSVPTALERAGDFSQSILQGRPVTVIDPLTRQPFPGNVIPADRISPIARAFLDEVVPLPNEPTAGNPNAYSQTYELSSPANQYLVRLDHLISTRHRVTASYFFNKGLAPAPLDPFTYSFRDVDTAQHNANIHEYWTITSTLLNHFRLGYARNAGSRTLRNEPQITASDLGIAYGNLPSGPPVAPGFTLTGYFAAIQQSGGPKYSNIYSLADTLTWIRGRHTLKVGGEAWLRRLFDVSQDGRNGGDFRFNGNSTGNSFADLLLGYVSDRFRYRDSSYKSNNQWAFYGFVQDDFRVSDRLTLNLGLRYELDKFPVHPLDQIVVWVPGQQSTCVPQAPTGVVFPCDPGIPRAGFRDDTNNFAPRLGFAYDLTSDGRTVLRGGYGLTYAFAIFNTLQEGQVGIPFAIRDEKRNTAPRNAPASILLADPWATVPDGNPFPFNADPAHLEFPSTGSYTAATLDLPSGYVHQYNLSLQRQFGDDTVVELAYVGNRGHGLAGFYNINQAVLSPTGTAANLNSRRPMGGVPFGDFTTFKSNVRSWYDSLQARVEKRFRHGFSLMGSYTYGKALDYMTFHSNQTWSDPTRPELDKARSDNDRRHLLAVSFLVDLPFFKDDRGLAGLLLGGWQVNGIGIYYSGLPVDVIGSKDFNLDGNAADRPNLVGEWQKPRPSSDDLVAGATWFDTAAFAPPAVGKIGSFGRNVISGPDYKNVDLVLSKRIHLRGTHEIQLRLEAYNVFNFTNFNNPNGNTTSNDFGKVTSVVAPRILQLGARYSF